MVPLNLFYALSVLDFDRKKDKHTLSVDEQISSILIVL